MPHRLLIMLFGGLSSGLLPFSAYAQQGSDPAQPPAGCVVYTTPSAADAWLATVRQQPLSQQLAAVRQRLSCDAGLRPARIPVCYMGVSDLTRRTRTPPPVDPRPEGLGLVCMLDGYPLVPEVRLALQHLLTVRSIKKLTFVASHEVSAIPVWNQGSGGGAVLITTKRPKATRRQWQLAVQQASASAAKP